ncbi:hypothetical protein D3C81_1750290 [compost metagenome]
MERNNEDTRNPLPLRHNRHPGADGLWRRKCCKLLAVFNPSIACGDCSDQSHSLNSVMVKLQRKLTPLVFRAGVFQLRLQRLVLFA